MNSSKIVSRLNNQNRLDNVIPLSSITSSVQREELAERKYYIGYTKSEWEEAFPDIDVTKIYVHQSCLFPAGYAYIDFDRYIYVPSVFYRPEEVKGMPRLIKIFRGRIKKMEEYADKKDFFHLLCCASSEQSGNGGYSQR